MARQPRPPPRARAAPRVYALEVETEAQEEETNPEDDEAAAITSTLHLCDVECYTLFDTGATHSFLSLEKAKKLNMERIDTKSDFTVRTPSGETLPVHGTLRDVSLDICGRDLAADLIVVPIGGYSLILGMDWLSKHRAQIDCRKRTI
ncbi:PREDICTED: uncharacterized protein LOC109116045 [Tarenaya hassleriana]|uniref:uncharacterized protein LOC109116045 n=1 Tax=Tarenaya hassleriana TaxID=28532 RepID=UPI0008FD8815|nr:PREDICTED: uncharacterized protein LOC109116045 [Tarenaya hassleriana]